MEGGLRTQIDGSFGRCLRLMAMANMHAISQEVWPAVSGRGKGKGDRVTLGRVLGGHENMLRFCKNGCHAKTNRSGNKLLLFPPSCHSCRSAP